jgi:hypothetical protein
MGYNLLWRAGHRRRTICGRTGSTLFRKPGGSCENRSAAPTLRVLQLRCYISHLRNNVSSTISAPRARRLPGAILFRSRKMQVFANNVLSSIMAVAISGMLFVAVLA